MISVQSKHILFRTACDPDTGTGHLLRCITLAEELKHRGHQVLLITDDNHLSRVICRRFSGDALYVASDILVPAMNKPSQALIIDLPPSQRSLLDQPGILSHLSSLNDAGVSIVSLGHVGRTSRNFRAVIDLYPRRTVHAANYFEGPEFLILRPEFLEAPPAQSTKTGVLVSMGGSDPHDLTSTALNTLMEYAYEGPVHVVLGAGYSAEKEQILRKRMDGSGLSAIFYRDVRDMRSLMRQSRAGMAAFGTTAYELMSQNVAVMAYTHYEWQIPSAKLFETLGACVYLGCAEKPDEIPSLAEVARNCLADPAVMNEMAKRGRDIVDGKGAKRVASLIENMMTAEKDDQLLDVLFVLAHPGDELLGCGGTLLRHMHAGEKVGLVILGDGVSSRRKESDEEAAVMAARKELRTALQKTVDKLGLSTWYYFRFEDNRFDRHDLLEIIQTIEPVLKRHRPRIVYTNHPGDLNIDHRRTFEAVVTALRPGPEQRLESLFSVEVPTSTDWGISCHPFQPNWFVDIHPHLEEKMDIINFYSRELREDPHPRSPQGIRDRALNWGRFIGLNAAEAFVLHRHVTKNTASSSNE